jgi:hypothetical protein
MLKQFVYCSALILICSLSATIGCVLAQFYFIGPLNTSSQYLFWASLIVSAFVCHSLILGERGKKLLVNGTKQIFTLLALTFLSIYLSSFFRSLNYDGMETHQEKIIALANGWNPIQDPYFHEADIENNILLKDCKIVNGGGEFRVNYILSALIYKATGKIETGKTLNFLYLIVYSAISFYVIGHFLKGFNHGISTLIAILNPIIIVQLYSYYVDGQLAALYGSILLLCLFLCKERKISTIIAIILLGMILVGTKKVGIGLLGLALPLTFIAIIIRSQRKLKWISITSISSVCIIFVGIFGGEKLGLWDSSNGFPFTPSRIITLMDSETMDYWLGTEIPGSDRPYPMRGMNRMEQFWASNMSETHILREEIRWKKPFTISQSEFDFLKSIAVDLRMGGFGPLYGGIFLISLLVLAHQIIFHLKESRILLYLLLVLILPCFFLPTWWARWIPFMWLFPLVIFGYVITKSKIQNLQRLSIIRFGKNSPTLIAISYLGMIIMALNIALVSTSNIYGHINENRNIDQDLHKIESWNTPVVIFTGPFKSNRVWFYERNIPFTMVDHEFEDPKLIFLRTRTQVGIQSE